MKIEDALLKQLKAYELKIERLEEKMFNVVITELQCRDRDATHPSVPEAFQILITRHPVTDMLELWKELDQLMHRTQQLKGKIDWDSLIRLDKKLGDWEIGRGA